jgi:penicillin-insensitive murein DD-endopeptidase
MHFAKNRTFVFCVTVAMSFTGVALAQSTVDQAGLAQMASTPPATPPAQNILKIPAKKLFGNEKLPAKLAPRAIGDYAKGCMAGGAELPINGPSWQVMRLSRNRNWAMPQTISLVERLATEAKKYDGWNGLLVGDMAQPRGGPMLTGHASHQIGLDADIWFTPMPDRILSGKERETYVPLEMVKNHTTLNQDNWSESRARLIKRAAAYPEVGRIFVHPPIKAALCKWASNQPGDKSWLAKVRPLFGHTFHFHIRLNCPPGMKICKNQWKPAPKDGTGCGEELAYWLGPIPWTPKKRDPNAPPYVPPPPLTLSGLPAECRAVVAAP